MTLEEMIAEKDSLTERMREETATMTRRLDDVEAERVKYMAKVETIIGE